MMFEAQQRRCSNLKLLSDCCRRFQEGFGGDVSVSVAYDVLDVSELIRDRIRWMLRYELLHSV